MVSKPLEFNTGRNGFCVARPPNKYAVLFNGLHIKTESNIIPRPSSQDVIWLDLAFNGKIAGTSQQVSNKAWEWSNLAGWLDSKCYSVPRACIYQNNNSLITVQNKEETGSLGYIQVDDAGKLVKTVDHYADKVRGIYEYIIRGNVTVGHGDKSSLGENPLICKIDGQIYLLEKGNCLAIKFYREGDDCAIAWINGSLSKVWFVTVAELKTFPIYNPIPENPPVAIPNHKDVVERARVKYNSLSGLERASKIVNQVAWDLRVEGAGTLYKDSGTQYNNRSIDIIIYKPNKETFDILGDAENSAVPAWGRTSPTGFGDISKWRAAEDPGGSTPPPTPTNPSTEKLIDIRNQINEFLGDS